MCKSSPSAIVLSHSLQKKCSKILTKSIFAHIFSRSFFLISIFLRAFFSYQFICSLGILYQVFWNLKNYS